MTGGFHIEKASKIVLRNYLQHFKCIKYTHAYIHTYNLIKKSVQRLGFKANMTVSQ